MTVRTTSAAVITLALLTACQSVGRPAPSPSASSPLKVAPSTASPALASASATPPGLDKPSQILDLFPEGVPGRIADAPPERIEDGRVFNVSVPTLAVYPPPAGVPNTGVAVIVCPGGGYVRLAVNKEGSEVSRWLNSLG